MTQPQMLSFARIMPTPPMSGETLGAIVRYVVSVEANYAKRRAALQQRIGK
jgi:hypothetical protein